VGNFSGTYLVNAQGGQGAMSVAFTKQKSGSVTGTFNLPLLGRAVTTTVNLDGKKTMRGNIKTDGNEFSLTATVSTNGKYVTGRWSLPPRERNVADGHSHLQPAVIARLAQRSLALRERGLNSCSSCVATIGSWAISS